VGRIHEGWVRRAVGLLFDIVFEGSWDSFGKIGLRADLSSPDRILTS
jgi:hypothetical protein